MAADGATAYLTPCYRRRPSTLRFARCTKADPSHLCWQGQNPRIGNGGRVFAKASSSLFANVFAGRRWCTPTLEDNIIDNACKVVDVHLGESGEP